MLRSGIINPHLLAGLARLRHTDAVVIADAGLPIPSSVPAVDLTLVYGQPRFEDVLRAVAETLVVEGAVAAQEARGTAAEDWIRSAVNGPLSFVPHDGSGGFKDVAATAQLIVRTGEDTPYANVVLRCGVPF